MFFNGYAAASGKLGARRFPDGEGRDLKAALQTDNDYLVKLRAALDGNADANPFSGALPRAQTIRLQR